MYASKNRIKGIPKRHKGDAPDSVLAPTGRYVDRKRAREYVDDGQYGTGKTFDLIEFGSEGRKELYLRRKNQKIEGRMNKTKPSAMLKKESSKSLSYTKQELNKYRKDLKKLYEKKAKQKLESKKITCEIRKLKITDNPYLIEKNKKKLLKLAEKACKLSEEYSNNELKLKLLKNASYKNEKMQDGGAKKSKKKRVKKSKKNKN